MTGMILAAGLGTRLRPLTDHCPKALIDIAGQPAIARVIDRMISSGIRRIIVNVHHMADMLSEFLKRYSEKNGIEIEISDERDNLLNTGGGLAKAATLLDDQSEILVYNADIMTDFNLCNMLAAHKNDVDRDVTLLVSERKTSRRLLFDCNGYMRGWFNELTGNIRPDGLNAIDLLPYAFGGIHIIGAKALKLLQDYQPGESFSITDFYIDFCSDIKIKSYTPSEPYNWFDIGKPTTLAQARKLFSE